MATDSRPHVESDPREPNDSGKFRDVYLPIGFVVSILAIVVGGGIAWGDAQAQLKSMSAKVTALEENRKMIEDVKIEQAFIKAGVEGVRREQGIYVDTLKVKVDQLDRKLDLVLERVSSKR